MPEQVEGVVSLPKFEELGIETNFLKVGDQVFAVKKVASGFKVEDEMRSFYAHKVNQLDELMKKAVVKEIEGIHAAQLNRINALRTRGQVAIPSNMMGKCVAYTKEAGEVMECVPVVYHPWQIHGTKQQFTGFRFDTSSGDWTKLNSSDEVQVTVQTSIYIPAFIGIAKQTRRLYALGGLKTPHTMAGNYLCIGNSKFEDYAKLDSLEMSKQISIINLFSPATSEIRFGEPATVLTLQQFFSDWIKVVKVEKRERTSWTV